MYKILQLSLSQLYTVSVVELRRFHMYHFSTATGSTGHFQFSNVCIRASIQHSDMYVADGDVSNIRAPKSKSYEISLGFLLVVYCLNTIEKSKCLTP